MDGKRGWIGFVILIAFVILSISFVSSAACSVTTYPCPSSYPYVVMKLSSTTNAHGELASYSNYGSALCCDFAPTQGHTCSGSSNKVLGLSSATNAHAETQILKKTGIVKSDDRYQVFFTTTLH